MIEIDDKHLHRRRADQTVFGMLGAAIAIVGTIASVNLVSNDPAPPGANFWPALTLAITLLIAPLLRLRATVSSVLRAEHILMIALVYWLLLDPIQSAYPMDYVTSESVAAAFTAIGTMAVGIWLGSTGKGWPLPTLFLRITRMTPSRVTLIFAICLTFILGMFHYVISSGFDLSVMIAGVQSARFAAPWDRDAIGGWSAFTEHMIYFGYMLPSLTVLLAHERGWLQLRVAISGLFSFIMMLFLMQSGGRRIIGVVVGAALVTWFLTHRRLTFKLLVVGSIVAVILLIIMQQMVQYRKLGLQGWLSGETPAESFEYLHVDDNFLRLSQVAWLFPDYTPYVGLGPLWYMLTRPIPRVLWPEKPSDPGYDLASLVNLRGSTGTTLTQSLVGELYAMGGLLPVFIGGLVLGRLASMSNKILNGPNGTGKTLTLGLAIMVLFVSIRSMQDLLIMSYGFLGWILIASILYGQKSNHVVPSKRA
jgi:hypothetical protein